MEPWLGESLSNLLGFPVPDDMIKYVMSIDNNKQLQEHMKTLLDFENVNHRAFFDELIKRRFGPGAGRQKKKIAKSKDSKGAELDKSDSQHLENAENSQNEANKNKKKTKFISLYSQEGQNAQVVFLKGRHHCDCQASKHGLINNCVNCGRIVCEQEGSGPCLFCGQLVCTTEEMKKVNSNTKAGAKLMQSLMEKNRPVGWEVALAHRNKLLEYDRTSEKRTHVTDDDSDYFSSNSVWLSAEEREKLRQYEESVREKKHASRRGKKITFDFGGRRVIEEESDISVDENKINEIRSSQKVNPAGGDKFFSNTASDRDVAAGINAELLAFDPSVDAGPARRSLHTADVSNSRVQDAELQEMVDAGKCMSMHQPWASLLVEGIKLHEGRTWYTSHRGRLWIASTAKQADPETVGFMEQFYRKHYPDKEFNFPTFYPSGCLLGCVNVDDCLQQEEYEKKYPGGESDSPFVFICSNPVSLRVRFPVKGEHKIYNLDKVIHKAAVKFMLKSAKQSAENKTEA